MTLKEMTLKEELIAKHCANLIDFKREKLNEMSNRETRKRLSIAELYSSDVETIAKLVQGTIRSYEIEEELSLKTAQERALSDYQFWYTDNIERQQLLEEIIFNENNQ